MEKTSTALSKQLCGDTQKIQELIREWVAKLAVNAGASLDAKTQAVFCSIWFDGLSDLSPSVLLAAFHKTLQECAYWPVKVADIRKHIIRAEQNAGNEEAEQAWKYVLNLRQRFWSPDAPGGFWRGMPTLDDRIDRAARAAGIWRDFPDLQSLHVWAKKEFIDAFMRLGAIEQDELLLPDVAAKKLIRALTEGKYEPNLLPSSEESSASERATEERLRVADELCAAAREVLDQKQKQPIGATRHAKSLDEQKAEMRRRGWIQ